MNNAGPNEELKKIIHNIDVKSTKDIAKLPETRDEYEALLKLPILEELVEFFKKAEHPLPTFEQYQEYIEKGSRKKNQVNGIQGGGLSLFLRFVGTLVSFLVGRMQDGENPQPSPVGAEGLLAGVGGVAAAAAITYGATGAARRLGFGTPENAPNLSFAEKRKRDLRTPICIALLAGDFPKIKALVASDISILTAPCDEDLNYPIATACILNRPDIAMYLSVEMGKDSNWRAKLVAIDNKNIHNETALNLACKHITDPVPLVTAMLDSGADSNIPDRNGDSPLISACKRKLNAVAVLLLRPSTELFDTAFDEHTTSAFTLSVYEPMLAEVHRYIAARDLTGSKSNAAKALSCIIKGDIFTAIRTIRDTEVELHYVSKTYGSKSLLMTAIDLGYGSIARILIDKGANIHEVFDNASILMHASFGGMTPIVNLLLEKGADLFYRNPVLNRTALDTYMSITKLGLENKIFQRRSDGKRNTMVIPPRNKSLGELESEYTGKTKSLIQLLQLRFRERTQLLNGIDSNPRTLEQIESLLAEGVDLDITVDGLSPLHYACFTFGSGTLCITEAPPHTTCLWKNTHLKTLCQKLAIETAEGESKPNLLNKLRLIPLLEPFLYRTAPPESEDDYNGILMRLNTNLLHVSKTIDMESIEIIRTMLRRGANPNATIPGRGTTYESMLSSLRYRPGEFSPGLSLEKVGHVAQELLFNGAILKIPLLFNRTIKPCLAVRIFAKEKALPLSPIPPPRLQEAMCASSFFPDWHNKLLHAINPIIEARAARIAAIIAARAGAAPPPPAPAPAPAPVVGGNVAAQHAGRRITHKRYQYTKLRRTYSK